MNQILLTVRKECEAAGKDALVEKDLPETFIVAIRAFITEAEAWLVLNQQTEFRQDLLDFYFQCLY